MTKHLVLSFNFIKIYSAGFVWITYHITLQKIISQLKFFEQEKMLQFVSQHNDRIGHISTLDCDA